MNNEIVKSYPPFAGFGIRRMMELRMYIEHCLLARKLNENERRSWILNRKDVIWRAVCRFYSLMLEVRIQNHPELQEFEEAVSRIAAGGLILGFEYPHEWD